MDSSEESGPHEDFDDSDESGPFGYVHQSGTWKQFVRQARAIDAGMERILMRKEEEERRERTLQRVREIQELAQVADEIWADRDRSEERFLKYDIERYRRFFGASFLNSQDQSTYANLQHRLEMRMTEFEIPETDENDDVIPFNERVEMLPGGEEGIVWPAPKKTKI